MEFIKLNDGWNAEPNAPMTEIEAKGTTVIVSFYLNAFIYPEYNEGDKGVIEFYNCRQYRMGSPNDEGFYVYNQSRYKKYGVKWGEFYFVQDSDWKSNFPQPILIDTSIKEDRLNHYLFYFRDGAFECISESYTFSVIKADPLF